jgi:hypothetical protein
MRSPREISHDRLQAFHDSFPIRGHTLGWRGHSIGVKHTVHATSREFFVSHTLQTRPLLCSWRNSPSSCKSHMSYIGRMQSISFDTYRAPSPFGFTMQHNLHWTSSGSLILTGLAITLIASPHMVTHSVWFEPICWSSKKQVVISLSSVEAEYRGVFNITIQAMWLKHFLTELGIQFHRPIVIWCDNQSTLKFCRDPVQSQQTKHIEIHMHYI